MTSEESKFNLNTVHHHLTSALHDDDDVELQSYLNSFKELNKFFLLMGSIFSYVSQELEDKVSILLELVKDQENFVTVKMMIEYEKNNKLLNKKGYTSGSRTLLRLNRGLEFIKEFLKNVYELKELDPVSPACREAYDQTLGNYHPFLIKQGARLAMYTLPNRTELLVRVCGEEEEMKRALELLPQTLEIMMNVFERVHSVYTAHDLHSLP